MSKYTSTKVYGDSEGPLGFRMRSEDAKALEGLLKDLNSDCKELVKDGPVRWSTGAKVSDVDAKERTEVSWVTTDSIDRDNEVMLPKGMDWSQWRKNPAVTFAHDYGSLPVGRGLWAKANEKGGMKGWQAKTQYTKRPEGHEGPWFPDSVWHMVNEGSLPGKSIGFIPTEMRPPAEKEIKDRPKMAGVSRVITKATILEYAVAPVQSNPDAILVSVGKGLHVPDAVAKALGLVIPDPVAPRKYRSVSALKAEMYGKALRGLKGMDAKAMGQSVIDRLKGKV